MYKYLPSGIEIWKQNNNNNGTSPMKTASTTTKTTIIIKIKYEWLHACILIHFDESSVCMRVKSRNSSLRLHLLNIVSNCRLPYDFVLPKTRFFLCSGTCSVGLFFFSLVVFFYFDFSHSLCFVHTPWRVKQELEQFNRFFDSMWIKT